MFSTRPARKHRGRHLTKQYNYGYTSINMYEPLIESMENNYLNMYKDKLFVCGPFSIDVGGWMLSFLGKLVPFLDRIVSGANRWLINGRIVRCLKWIGWHIVFRFFRIIFGIFLMKLEFITHVTGPVDYSNCPTEDSDGSSSVPTGNMIDMSSFANQNSNPEVDYLTIERDNLKQENDSLKQENDFLRQSIQAQEQRLKSASEQLDKQIKYNQKLSEEKENALTRLSEVAGSKLKYNNPGITDLSDDNRPNKLAEKFSELYDNEWTEAFEALEGDEFGEEEIIRRLLGILQLVYEECSTRTAEQRKQMFELIQGVGVPTCPNTEDKKASETGASKVNIHVSKKISDLQKDTASDIIPKIKQELQTSMVPELLPVVPKCDSYFKKCVTLCWMMRVQEPPVVLSFDCEKGKTVNADLYRHYTRTGTKIDYMVWPAMILYEGGPLLSKGVFQPLLEV